MDLLSPVYLKQHIYIYIFDLLYRERDLTCIYNQISYNEWCTFFEVLRYLQMLTLPEVI